MSYIKREPLLEKVKSIEEQCSKGGGYYLPNGAFLECKMEIVFAPSVDVVEVVHAYWKETKHTTESKRGREIHSKLYNCSNCDAPNGRKKSSYCHWCGAKMDGERREENER